MKYRAKTKTWETYSTLQYGVTDYMNVGADLYYNGSDSYIGYTFRTGKKFSPYFSVGAQFTPSFNLGENHKFAYMTEALYMNGNITRDGRMFWVTNTWLEQANHELSSAKQWTYLGYTCPLGNKGNSITPMAGIIHDWKFESDVDLSFGAYYSHKNINVYAWTNDILTDHPRFVLAVEFKFSNK
uniref:hypothetical protein n=1 Tax=Alloprevotella sp. TaxID=1872471 RepID=UPI00402915F8